MYLLEIIRTKIISKHHDNLLIDYYGIEETLEFVIWKYYWPTLKVDMETYIKRCNVCVASKAVRHKPYGNLELLPVFTLC